MLIMLERRSKVSRLYLFSFMSRLIEVRHNVLYLSVICQLKELSEYRINAQSHDLSFSKNEFQESEFKVAPEELKTQVILISFSKVQEYNQILSYLTPYMGIRPAWPNR